MKLSTAYGPLFADIEDAFVATGADVEKVAQDNAPGFKDQIKVTRRKGSLKAKLTAPIASWALDRGTNVGPKKRGPHLSRPRPHLSTAIASYEESLTGHLRTRNL